MNGEKLIALLWQRVLHVDECRKLLIEKEQEYIDAQKQTGLPEVAGKKAFYAQLGEYIKDMDNTVKAINDEENNSTRHV